MTDAYIELHAHSAFSFLEGASVPEELAGACAEFGMPAMALVDRNGLYGAPRFHMAARKAGVRAHIGSEITCASGRTYPLLAETREGYQNLCRLVTRMKLRSKKGEGAALPEEFGEFSEGLVCLTGDVPVEKLPFLLNTYGPRNLYAELQRHHVREEEARNQALIDFAHAHRVPLLATNGVSHADLQAREAMDALTCVRHKVKINEAGRLLCQNSERYFKSAQQMHRLFSDLPEAISNTVELSSRLR